jgi:hypothetical protein
MDWLIRVSSPFYTDWLRAIGGVLFPSLTDWPRTIKEVLTPSDIDKLI